MKLNFCIRTEPSNFAEVTIIFVDIFEILQSLAAMNLAKFSNGFEMIIFSLSTPKYIFLWYLREFC